VLAVAAASALAIAAYAIVLGAQCPAHAVVEASSAVLALLGTFVAAALLLDVFGVRSCATGERGDWLPSFDPEREGRFLRWFAFIFGGLFFAIGASQILGDLSLISQKGLAATRPSKVGRVAVVHQLVPNVVFAALGAAGLLGAVWRSRRSDARRLRALLTAPRGAAVPGAWCALEGEVAATVGEFAWVVRDASYGKNDPRNRHVSEGCATELVVVVRRDGAEGRRDGVGVDAGATFATTFFVGRTQRSQGGTISTFRQWVPIGARVLVAGRLERGVDDGLRLPLAGPDSILLLASGARGPSRAALRARLFAHDLLLLTAVLALVAAGVMVTR
jgi:hypothetical protein